jgi:hypothetical protein
MIGIYGHVSERMKTFVLEYLHLGLFVSQIMAKHMHDVKEIKETNGVLSRNFFYVNKTFAMWLVSWPNKPTNDMIMVQRVLECGCKTMWTTYFTFKKQVMNLHEDC